MMILQDAECLSTVASRPETLKVMTGSRGVQYPLCDSVTHCQRAIELIDALGSIVGGLVESFYGYVSPDVEAKRRRRLELASMGLGELGLSTPEVELQQLYGKIAHLHAALVCCGAERLARHGKVGHERDQEIFATIDALVDLGDYVKAENSAVNIGAGDSSGSADAGPRSVIEAKVGLYRTLDGG